MIRQHTTVPIAIGEIFNSLSDCKQLIEEELIDFIRIAVACGAATTHVKRIVELAALHMFERDFMARRVIDRYRWLRKGISMLGLRISEYPVVGTTECDALTAYPYLKSKS